jgi:hypothetical protein
MKTTLTFFGAIIAVALLSVNVQAEEFLWHSISSQVPAGATVIAADFTGDNHPDIIALTSTTIYGLQNNGFNQFQQSLLGSGYSQLQNLDKADIDGDGDLDIVFAAVASGGIYWLENRGGMHFTAHTIDPSPGYVHLAVADMDGNNAADIVVTDGSMGGGGLYYWEYLGAPGFRKHCITPDLRSEFDLTDFNGDGDMDVIGNHNGLIEWWENNGNQTFSVILNAWGLPTESLLGLKAGDLNRDGYQDIVVAMEHEILWFRNNANQSFTLDTIDLWFYLPVNLHLEDLDHDGWTDVVAVSNGWNWLCWYENFAGSYFDRSNLGGGGGFDLVQFSADDKIDIAKSTSWGENTLAPTLKLAFEPLDSLPIVIPPQGGSFDYRLYLQNCTEDTIEYDYWITAVREDTLTTTPVLLRSSLNRSCPPDTVMVQICTQTVLPHSGTYWYTGCAGIYPNTVYDFTESFVVIVGEQAADHLPVPPEETLLETSPNPFNPTTAISYQLQAPSYVSLRVFDTAGRLVTTLVEGWREAGMHQATFDGSGLVSGLYFARMQAGAVVATQKIMLLK